MILRHRTAAAKILKQPKPIHKITNKKPFKLLKLFVMQCSANTLKFSQ